MTMMLAPARAAAEDGAASDGDHKADEERAKPAEARRLRPAGGHRPDQI